MTFMSLTSATTAVSWFAKSYWNFDALQWMRANVNVWWIINFLRWLPVLERWGWRDHLAGVAGWWLVCQVGHRKQLLWFLFACFVLWFACFYVFEFLIKKMNFLSKESQHPLPPPPPLAPVTTKSEVAETCHYLLWLSCMIFFKRYVYIIYKKNKFVPTFIRVNISLHMKQPDVYPSWSIMFLSFSQESADAAPSAVDVTGPVLWHWGIIKKNMQCNEHKTCRYICACELSWNTKITQHAMKHQGHLHEPDTGSPRTGVLI